MTAQNQKLPASYVCKQTEKGFVDLAKKTQQSMGLSRKGMVQVENQLDELMNQDDWTQSDMLKLAATLFTLAVYSGEL